MYAKLYAYIIYTIIRTIMNVYFFRSLRYTSMTLHHNNSSVRASAAGKRPRTPQVRQWMSKKRNNCDSQTVIYTAFVYHLASNYHIHDGYDIRWSLRGGNLALKHLERVICMHGRIAFSRDAEYKTFIMSHGGVS